MSKKRYYIIVLLIATTFKLAAQVNIFSRGDSLLFIGLDNQVTITSKKIPVNKLKLVSNINGGISGKNGNYQIRCSFASSNYLLKVMHDNRLVAVKKMRVLRISDPEIYIAGDTLVNNGEISQKHLLSFDSVVTKINVPFIKFPFIRFDVIKISKGVIVDSLNNYGNKFELKIKKLFSSAIIGDTLMFENFRIGGPDDIRIPALKLTVIK